MSVRTHDFDLSALTPGSSEVRCAQLSHSSHEFAVSGQSQRQVCVWSLRQSAAIAVLQSATTDVTSVCFSQQEDQVFSGCSGGSIVVWDITQQTAVCTLSSHRGGCLALAALPRAQRALFASGSADCTVKLWDLRKRYCANTFRGHEGRVTAVGFSADGRYLASGSEDGNVKVWDCAASKKLSDLRSPSKSVTCLRFSPTHLTLAVGHQDGSLHCWKLDPQSSLSVSESTPVQQVCFHPQSSTLVIAGIHAAVHLWEPEKRLMRDAVDMPWRNLADIDVWGEGQEVVIGLAADGESLGVRCFDLSSLKAGQRPESEARRPNDASETAVSSQCIADLQEEHRAVVLLLAQRQKTIEELSALWANGRVLEALQTAEGLKDHSVLPALLEMGVWSGATQISMEACPAVVELCLRLLESKYEPFVLASLKTTSLLLTQHFASISAPYSLSSLHRLSPTRKSQLQQSELCLRALLRFRASSVLTATSTRGGGVGQCARGVVQEVTRLATNCGRWK